MVDCIRSGFCGGPVLFDLMNISVITLAGSGFSSYSIHTSRCCRIAKCQTSPANLSPFKAVKSVSFTRQVPMDLIQLGPHCVIHETIYIQLKVGIIPG